MKSGIRLAILLTIALTTALPVVVTAGPPPEDKCEASKNKIAGALYACLEKAESTSILKGTSPDYSKCTAKFLEKWAGAETKGEDTCPDNIAAPQDMADYLSAQAAEAASVIGGAAIPTCAADLETCQEALAECLPPVCDQPISCPPAGSGHQTICGQLYDLEDGSKFQAPGATGAQCSSTTASGPCSLEMKAYDALAFAADPGTAAPQATDPVYIDDCGRYRVPEITLPGGPLIGLTIDDATVVDHGPTGSTNTVAVATAKQGATATQNFDGWVASKATTDVWEGSGGPPVSGGLFVPIFFAQIDSTNRNLQSGVTVSRSGNPVPLQDNYFAVGESARQHIDGAATATGINGTALVTGASLGDGAVYSGSGGGLSASCEWPTYPASSNANVLAVQEIRPQSAVAQTCDR
jgi:hypothetical protein